MNTQDVANAIALLPNSWDYYGNPKMPFLGGASSEPYVFINIFATGTTVFDEVWSRGNLLESDNHTVSTAYVNPTGTPVLPEAGTGMAGVVASLGVLGYIRRRNQAKA